MLIKDEFRIKEGDVVHYRMRVPVEQDGMATSYTERNVQMVCVKNYPHHTDFKMLEHPYFIVNLTNAELYQLGFYKSEHFIRPFYKRG